jgi:hypothetical protein
MTDTYQRRVGAFVDHHRPSLQAHAVSDALTQVTAALADAVRHGDDRPGVWRLAAMRTTQLLAMLNMGAAALGEPLPPGSIELIQELRVWALTMGAEADNPLHRRADAAAQRSGSHLLPPPGPERGTPWDTGQRGGWPTPQGDPVPARPAEPARKAQLTARPPEPPVPLTNEQRAALFRLGRAGGRQHRDTLRHHILLELLHARLVAPEADEQVQITSHGLRSLASTAAVMRV